MEDSNLTIDEKLDDIEKLLIDSIHKKVADGESLSSQELQLVTRWLKSRDSISKPKKPKDTPPAITEGIPLPFLMNTNETLEEAIGEYDN